MLRQTFATATVALTVLAGLTGPAMAQGNSGQHRGGDHGPRSDATIDVHIDIGSRDIIRDYYGAPPGCPPGLAKKNNGCLPPGQAKKRYQIGHPLAVDSHRLPTDLLHRLPSPPSGHIYGRVDGDILLIAEATHSVVDAVVAVAAARDALEH